MGPVGENGDPLTPEEVAAIRALNRLAAKWPKTLRLVSMDGELFVIHAAGEHTGHSAVLATIDGIPNDGGG